MSASDVVVLVTHLIWIRVCKVALALKLQGIRVVLVHADDAFDRMDPEIKALFHDVLTFDSPEDAVLKAARFSPLVHHVFCNWNYEVARAFIHLRPGVIVVDTKDVIGGFVRPETLRMYPGRAADEKFCFEKADGICCSDLRTQHLKRKLGYRLPHRLLWADYCWPEGFTGERSERAAGTNVACVGSIETNPSSPLAYGYVLGRMLAEAGIAFHLFPTNPGSAARLQTGVPASIAPRLARYVQVHNTQSFLSLSRELGRFQAGILISSSTADYSGENETYYPFLADYLIASRLFDYHEAGLLILMQPMRLAARVFGRSGAVRCVRDLSQIVEIMSTSENERFGVNDRLRLDYHAHRLPRFYRQLQAASRGRTNKLSGSVYPDPTVGNRDRNQ